jgi:hypothetical protein
MMRGASLRSVAELLGHQSMKMKMTMRYAHLSSVFLSAEVSLLDPQMPEPTAVRLKPDTTTAGRVEKSERARKGQSAAGGDLAQIKVPDFVREGGSPHWTISATVQMDLRVHEKR